MLFVFALLFLHKESHKTFDPETTSESTRSPQSESKSLYPKLPFYNWTLKGLPEPSGNSSGFSLTNTMQTSFLSKRHTSVMTRSLITKASHWLITSQTNKHHGLATYARDGIDAEPTNKSPNESSPEWITIKVGGYCITNVYKPSGSSIDNRTLPATSPLSIVCGDFSSRCTSWGYSDTNADGLHPCGLGWNSRLLPALWR